MIGSWLLKTKCAQVSDLLKRKDTMHLKIETYYKLIEPGQTEKIVQSTSMCKVLVYLWQIKSLCILCRFQD